MRNKGLYIYVLTFVWLVLVTEKTQAQFQSMKFESLNIDNGLSHNNVQCLYRDSKGYLWVGTRLGLNKYDGQKNVVYKNDPFKKNSLSYNNIECIYEDRSHNIWVGTNLGLNFYDRKKDTFKQYILKSNNADLSQTENDNRVFSILEDSKGNIWCSTPNGLNKWNQSDSSFVKYFIPATTDYTETNVISSIISDNMGYLWLGTRNNKIWRLNSETLQFDSFTDSVLSSTNGLSKIIIRDNSGILWIGTYGKGLYSFNPTTLQFKHFSADGNGKGTSGNLIKNLFMKDQYLYISVDLGGINRLDLQTMQFEYFMMDENNENGLNSNTIQCIYKDNEDILYAGSAVAGVNIFNPRKTRFKTYRHTANCNNCLIYNAIFKFFEDSQGLIWIGTDGGGLSVFDPVQKSFKNFQHSSSDPYSISRNAVLAITEDLNHDVWVGTWGAGLNRFDRKTSRFYHFMPNTDRPEAISNPDIWDLYTDKEGNIWISYGWFGIDVFDIRKGVFRKYRPNAQDSALRCPVNTNRFIHQSDGKMGFATNNGYYILDSISNSLKKVEIFKDYDLADVYLDKKGNYWAGTLNNGLIIANADGTIENHNESNGFPSNSICGILEDHRGNIWVLTSSGLAEYKFESKQFRHYNYLNGLQGRLFSSFARLRAKDGTFYIGGFNGFNEFHPEDIKDNPFIPLVYIDEFRIFNEPVPIDTLNSPLKQSITETKEIVLSYKQSVFSFGFTAINFNAPESVIYAYMMQGYDDKWNYTNSSRRYVSYTNLDPGDYTFMVKATNNDGVWNETPTTISITITPPFWKTWWFEILAFLFIAGSVLSFYRIRISQLKQQKRVLEQNVNERTAKLQEANITLEEKQEKIMMQNESILRQRDILELKNTELEEKNHEILQITNLLHESDQMKIRFFSNISHDLRTPLTLILGYLESIVSGITNNKTLSDRLAIVTNNANRLLRLVNQLLDFQKIDSESLKLEAEYQDIILFSRNIFDSFSLQAEKRQIEYTLSSEIEAYNTWFDPDKLDKILFNLVSNAFKFTPDSGKITLELDFGDKNLTYNTEQETVIFRIIDSGIGIQKKDLDKIFDRFYQAENTLFRKQSGSGIGLALVKNLTKIHQGSISVKSKAGKGSCFEVVLTIGKSLKIFDVKPEEASINPQSKDNQYFVDSIPVEIAPKATELATILVVEDNEELRRFICDELASKYRIIEAGNGKQGLEIAISEQPDLVLSDVMMPIMDGFEMCEKLKLEWQTSHIPIIFLTAKADEGSLYHGIEIGADAYIRKPFHLKHVFIQVENLLANRRKLFDKFNKTPVESFKLLSTNSGDNKFLEKLYQVIEDHLTDNGFGVEELASEVNMSRSQLYKKVISILNISPGELIRTMRLKKAIVLLSDKNNSVFDVALMVGFADSPQFSRSFTNQYSVSPKQFQVQEIDLLPENLSPTVL